MYQLLSYAPLDSQNSSISNTKKQASIVLTKYGKQIKIESYIPEGITEFELPIDSDRNNPVSSAREIASTDPNPSERASIYQNDSMNVYSTKLDGILMDTQLYIKLLQMIIIEGLAKNLWTNI